MPVYRLSEELIFPDPRRAMREGLLAVGGDLSPDRLVLAYRLGIFPWYGENEPIMWWSPDPRCVLFPSAIHVSRRLERLLRQGRYRLTCNRAFDRVVRACAALRIETGEGTWLTGAMQQAYGRLYASGIAHSIEAWEGEDLVGGLYGVALGRFFFGESMFHTRPNASKVILARLARYLDGAGFLLLDCQVPNPHLMRMGASYLPRDAFLDLLEKGGLGPGGEASKVVMPDIL